MTSKNIKHFVEQLPEQYQPIFGYTEYNNASQRGCDDRLKIIQKIVTELQGKLKRPLKILDLGCAQGYFCLSLAKLGHDVTGVDMLEENINVCIALKDDHNYSNAVFFKGDIVDYIRDDKFLDFDLVIGLSVFHHICHLHGKSETRILINKLANQCSALIMEFALSSEPLYWAEAQPQSPEYFVEDIAFKRVLDLISTHLSSTNRPIYYCSNNYWFFPDSMEKIEEWSSKSHEYVGGAHQGTRKYYFSKNFVAKQYAFNTALKETNRLDLANETNFLETYHGKFKSLHVPQLICSGKLIDTGYIVSTRIPGQRLGSLKNISQPEHLQIILKDILAQLVELEKNGLYHSDLRIWNALYDRKHCFLIDFASIISENRDVSPPFDIYLSFLIFTVELSDSSELLKNPLRYPLVSPVWLRGSFQTWIKKIWSTPHTEWSFGLFRKYYKKCVINGTITDFSVSKMHPENQFYWMSFLEQFSLKWSEYVNQHTRHNDHVTQQIKNKLDIINAQLDIDNAQLDIVKTQLDMANAQLKERKSNSLVVESRLKEQEETIHNLLSTLTDTEKVLASAHTRIHLLVNSSSWKITRPIRFAARIVKNTMAPSNKVLIGFRQKGKMLLKSLMIKMAQNRRFRIIGSKVLSLFPGIHARVRKAINYQALIDSKMGTGVPDISERSLPESANTIYSALDKHYFKQ